MHIRTETAYYLEEVKDEELAISLGWQKVLDDTNEYYWITYDPKIVDETLKIWNGEHI